LLPPFTPEDDNPLPALLREIKGSPVARYHHRLHAVILVLQGRSFVEVGLWLDEQPRTLRRWVSSFRAQGLAGLADEAKTGRPPSLDERKRDRLLKDLPRGPRAFGFDAQVWDGEVLAQHLELRYGVRLGIRQCQRILKALA
jgi:transposase